MGSNRLNKKTQIRHISANLRKAGIEPDLIDLESEVDENLTYRENKKHIFELVHYQIEHKQISISEEAENTFYQAKLVMEQRGYAGKYDLKRRNQKLITEKQIKKNPSKADKWFKHPGRYDIEGIDSNDKTAGNTKSPLSSVPSKPDGVTTSGLPAESHSKNITEINMNQEFEKMSEKFNGKKDEDKEKKYKYKCGECGEYFNLPAEGQKCPFCGQ